MYPKTMKAAVIHEYGGPLAIEELRVRPLNQYEILVKVISCGVCHTDLHACNGDWPVKSKMPLVPGHEAIGLVAAMDHDVKSVQEGDVVGVPWLYSACGCCEFCLTGWETLCYEQQNGG